MNNELIVHGWSKNGFELYSRDSMTYIDVRNGVIKQICVNDVNVNDANGRYVGDTIPLPPFNVIYDDVLLPNDVWEFAGMLYNVTNVIGNTFTMTSLYRDITFRVVGCCWVCINNVKCNTLGENTIEHESIVVGDTWCNTPMPCIGDIMRPWGRIEC